MNRQDQQLQSLLRSMAGEELRWQQHLWELWECSSGARLGERRSSRRRSTRASPAAGRADRLAKSTSVSSCRSATGTTGWDDPLGNGYQPRLPHHTPELQQAIARGLLPEQAEAVEEEE